MIALNERLPDSFKLLLPAGHPGPGEGRRRSLREVVADRRTARATQRTGPPQMGLAEWVADRQRLADQHSERRQMGAVDERRMAEALRAWAAHRDPGERQQREDPAAGRTPGARGWRSEQDRGDSRQDR